MDGIEAGKLGDMINGFITIALAIYILIVGIKPSIITKKEDNIVYFLRIRNIYLLSLVLLCSQEGFIVWYKN